MTIFVVTALLVSAFASKPSSPPLLNPTPIPTTPTISPGVASYFPSPTLILKKSATANWKTYVNTAFGYSFKYPPQWGVGTPCETETRIGFVGIGPELLEYPTTNCGTANIPPTVFFYVDSTLPSPPNIYQKVAEKNIFVNQVEGIYRSYDNHTFQFTLPVNNSFLIASTGAYESPDLESNFLTILSTLKITN